MQITRSMQVLVRMDDPAAARAELMELISAGAAHLVLAPVPPWPARPAAWLAEEIVAPVLAQWQQGAWSENKTLAGRAAAPGGALAPPGSG